MTDFRLVRWGLASAAAAILVPPVVAGVAAVTHSVPLGLVAGVLGAVFLVRHVARRLDLGVDVTIRSHRVVAALWIVLALAAGVQSTRLSVFMYDPARTTHSMMPWNAFFNQHTCMSGYIEAARIVRQPGMNVYDPANFMDTACDAATLASCRPRMIGRIELDLYQYPPPFLLLPAALRLVSHDLLVLRTLWFTVQVLLLGGAVMATSRWVGGAAGRTAALLSPVLWLSFSTLLGLQLGNFQVAACAISMAAMVAIEKGHVALGTVPLAFASLGKFYPGYLVVYLLGRGRYRAVAWTAAWCIVITAVSVLVVGDAPFRDFLWYQMPRVASGEAFFWIDSPLAIAVNHGIYGLLAKLRTLGLAPVSSGLAMTATSIYGALLLAVAGGVGWLSRRADAPGQDSASMIRLTCAMQWLALLNLGSFRSPFVPDAYGLMGSVWLVTLMAAAPGALSSWRRATPLLSCVILFYIVMDGTLREEPARVFVWLGLLIQVTALVVNVFGLRARAARRFEHPSDHAHVGRGYRQTSRTLAAIVFVRVSTMIRSSPAK
ncbi:MAG TPA: glycosyltransferase family 87 protein [Gemmatimonadaceae bacterium]|nr:glycosyltransferase family 87 protein [Gemmatimonadaceae bacterium]